MASLSPEPESPEGKGKRAASPTVAEEAEEFAFSLTHYLPVLVACIPPIGAVFGGTAAVWTDILLLMLVCYYLLQLVKVPWALYYASRAKRMAYSASHEGSELSSQAARDLRKTELGALLLTLLAPFLGSYMLTWMKPAFSEPERYINEYSIRLFTLAAGIKPFTHAYQMLKRRSHELQTQIEYRPKEVDQLKMRVESLEGEVAALRKSVASKGDVRLLRDAVDTPLTELFRQVKRFDRKGEFLRAGMEERLEDLEARLEASLALSEGMAFQLEALRRHQSHFLAQLFDAMRAQVFGDNRPWYSPSTIVNVFVLPFSVPLQILSLAQQRLLSDSRGFSAPSSRMDKRSLH